MSITKSECVPLIFIFPPRAQWGLVRTAFPDRLPEMLDMSFALLQVFCFLSIISLAGLPSKCQTTVWFYDLSAYALTQCHE